MCGFAGIFDPHSIFNSEDADKIIEIKTIDAIHRAKLFARETGILIGISSGANLLAAERFVNLTSPSGIVTTMLCDRGERYMSVFGE